MNEICPALITKRNKTDTTTTTTTTTTTRIIPSDGRMPQLITAITHQSHGRTKPKFIGIKMPQIKRESVRMTSHLICINVNHSFPAASLQRRGSFAYRAPISMRFPPGLGAGRRFPESRIVASFLEGRLTSPRRPDGDQSGAVALAAAVASPPADGSPGAGHVTRLDQSAAPPHNIKTEITPIQIQIGPKQHRFQFVFLSNKLIHEKNNTVE